MDDAADWERLAGLLDDDEEFRASVRESLDSGVDPWDALLDGLDDAGALAFLDVADSGMELSDALAQLPRVFRLQADLDAVADTDDLTDAIRAADRVLAAGGRRLIRLDQADPDAIALVVVPAAGVPEVLRLAARLRRGITTFD